MQNKSPLSPCLCRNGYGRQAALSEEGPSCVGLETYCSNTKQLIANSHKLQLIYQFFDCFWITAERSRRRWEGASDVASNFEP